MQSILKLLQRERLLPWQQSQALILARPKAGIIILQQEHSGGMTLSVYKQEIARREALRLLLRLLAAVPVFLCPYPVCTAKPKTARFEKEKRMKLPNPKIHGEVSLENCIRSRRTVRTFSSRKLGVDHLSQLLWAAQGITEKDGFKRAAPSAGALYPMELFVLTGSGTVSGMDPGIYHYDPGVHSLSLTVEGDLRGDLAKATLAQFWMAKAPINIAICAEYRRITGKYGDRGERYAIMESGFIAQNIFLQASAQGLVAGIAGAFLDAEVRKVLCVEAGLEPLLIMAVGFG